MTTIPEALMTRFRTVAMQRLERIDEAWTILVRGHATADTDRDLLRDVHTLKGDAKVVGLTEASLLCQRLEDLLAAAKAKGYRVHDDVDIVVTMTIQFLGMLVRKQSSARRGIDLDGFMTQIEQVMSEWLRRSSEAPERRQSVGPHLRIKDHERLTTSSGLRLSSSTTSVFLEQLRNTGEARERIRGVWKSLLAGVNEAHSAPLTSMIVGQGATAREIAGDLGKRLRVSVEGDETAVTPETCNVIGVLLVHALRNAVDHGIEHATVRASAGKSPVAEIRIDIQREGEDVCVSIADDGAGVDIERVRKRAVELGLMSAELAPLATEEQVLLCLFASGFSTREASTDISGRGIGLDAAHAAVVGHGGLLTITTRPGQGTTVRAKMPDIRGTMEVVSFEGSASNVRFGVPGEYQVRRSELAPSVVLEDVVRLPMSVKKGTFSLEIMSTTTHVIVAAGSLPIVRRALRRCPTPDTDLTEVVWVDGAEVVLVRPAVLHARAKA